jgi:hypothetical protein
MSAIVDENVCYCNRRTGMAHKLNLNIKATNGAQWETDEFGSNQKVDHVRKVSEKHFEQAGEMSPGDYLLGLVIDGTIQDLIDSEKLEDAGVGDGSVLVLKPRGGQVDG